MKDTKLSDRPFIIKNKWDEKQFELIKKELSFDKDENAFYWTPCSYCIYHGQSMKTMDNDIWIRKTTDEIISKVEESNSNQVYITISDFRFRNEHLFFKNCVQLKRFQTSV